MNRYVIKFEKDGYVKYTSHLDMQRMFKRAFKRAGIALRYSQGYNPHPKISFAQPLSLGYSSKDELLEVEIVEPCACEMLLNKLQAGMPEGITLRRCIAFDNDNCKSLAAEAIAATYTVWIPLDGMALQQETLARWMRGYLAQPSIIAMKRQKKTKRMAPVEIRSKIRQLTGRIEPVEQKIVLTMSLDCGSTSNLSPELVIQTFCAYSRITTPRHAIEVERSQLVFDKNLQF